MKLKKSILAIICFVAIICLPTILHAQPVFGDDVDDVPIDGGLSLLVAAGVGYGVKKLRNNKKKISE